jgi:hypothetical protein
MTHERTSKSCAASAAKGGALRPCPPRRTNKRGVGTHSWMPQQLRRGLRCWSSPQPIPHARCAPGDPPVEGSVLPPALSQGDVHVRFFTGGCGGNTASLTDTRAESLRHAQGDAQRERVMRYRSWKGKTAIEAPCNYTIHSAKGRVHIIGNFPAHHGRSRTSIEQTTSSFLQF